MVATKIHKQKKNNLMVPGLALVLLFSFSLEGRGWTEHVEYVDDGRGNIGPNRAAITQIKKNCSGGAKVKSDNSEKVTKIVCKGEKLYCKTANKYEDGKGCKTAALEYQKVKDKQETLEESQKYLVAATQLIGATTPIRNQKDAIKQSENLGTAALGSTVVTLGMDLYNYNELRKAEKTAESAETSLVDKSNEVWTAFREKTEGLKDEHIVEILKQKSLANIKDSKICNQTPGNPLNCSPNQINAINDIQATWSGKLPSTLDGTGFNNYGEYRDKFENAENEANAVKNKIASKKEELLLKTAFNTLGVYIQTENLSHMKDARRSLESLNKGDHRGRTHNLAGLRNPDDDSGALGYRGNRRDYSDGGSDNGRRAFSTIPDEIGNNIEHNDDGKYNTAPTQYRAMQAASGGLGTAPGGGGGIPNNQPGENSDNNYGEVVQYGSGGSGLNNAVGDTGGESTAMQEAIKSLLSKNEEQKEEEEEAKKQYYSRRGRGLASLSGMEGKDSDTRSIFERVRAKYQDVVLQGIL